MLFNDHICKVLSQNFYVQERAFLENNIFAQNCQLLMSIREIFRTVPNLQNGLARQAYTVLENSCKLTEDDFELREEQLAIYATFLSGLVYAYDTQEPVPAKRLGLYTTSMSVLKQLASSGLLKGKKEPIDIELPAIEKTIYGSTRIKKSLDDGTKIVSVRLDFELTSDGNVSFKPTIPRSAIEMGRYVFVASSTMNEAIEKFSALLRERVLRVTMGDKVRAITLNPVVLKSLYGKDRAQFLLSARKDIRTQSFYVPSVGASIYTAGVTNIRIADLDKVEVVNSIADLDLSELKFNYAMVKPFFYESLKNLNKDAILMVANDFAEDKGIDTDMSPYDFIVSRTIHTGSHVIWDYMKKHADIFDTRACLAQPNIFGGLYEQLTIPDNIADLRKLTNMGTFKILIQKRDGTYSSTICTNSNAELVRVLGKDYIKYESEGVRLTAVLNYMRRNIVDEAIDLSRLKSILTAYMFVDVYFNIADELETSEPSEIYDLAIKYLEKMQLDVDMRKTVINQPHLLTVRNLAITVDSEGKAIDYYKSIDPKSIVELVCLHKVENK